MYKRHHSRVMEMVKNNLTLLDDDTTNEDVARVAERSIKLATDMILELLDRDELAVSPAPTEPETPVATSPAPKKKRYKLFPGVDRKRTNHYSALSADEKFTWALSPRNLEWYHAQPSPITRSSGVRSVDVFYAILGLYNRFGAEACYGDNIAKVAGVARGNVANHAKALEAANLVQHFAVRGPLGHERWIIVPTADALARYEFLSKED